MGNTASNCIGRGQFDVKIGRHLPAELLNEIVKFIPLKVERKNNKKKWEEEEETGKVRNFIKKSLNRLPIRRKIVKGNVQPVNADLLVVNSRLTAFLRPRCRALQQMIVKLQTDFAIEMRDNFSNIFIKKRQINEYGEIMTNSPISMLEMLRHICLGRIHFCNQNYETIQFDGDLPMDFEANQFLDCLVQFIRTVPNSDPLVNFQIGPISFDQGQQMENAFRQHFKKEGSRYKITKLDHLIWSLDLDLYTQIFKLGENLKGHNLNSRLKKERVSFTLHLSLKKAEPGAKVERYYYSFTLSSHFK